MNEVISVKRLHPWIVPILQGFIGCVLVTSAGDKAESSSASSCTSHVLQEKEGSEEPHAGGFRADLDVAFPFSVT